MLGRYLPPRPPDREIWTHLAWTAAIWLVLYQVKPERFIQTDGPAGIITIFALGVVALFIAIAVWMVSPNWLRRAMVRLRWLVPIAFLAVAYVEKSRLQRNIEAKQNNVTIPAPPRVVATELPVHTTSGADTGEARWPPKVDRQVSDPLPMPLPQATVLVVIYRWEAEGRQLRFPIRLKAGATAESIAGTIQNKLDRSEVPLWVYIGDEQRLHIESRRPGNDDRWIIGSETASPGLGFPVINQ